jgi:DNA-binding Xre family transcriptional regulator
MEDIHGSCFRRNEILADNNIGKFQVVSFTWKNLNRQTYIDPLELRLLRTNVKVIDIRKDRCQHLCKFLY